jgi:hypothetical protein
MEFLLLDIADLFFQSSYRISCLTLKNHVVEKTGPCFHTLFIAVIMYHYAIHINFAILAAKKLRCDPEKY